MSTLLQTDGPVTFDAGGKTWSLPRLSIRAYLPWIAELHQQWIASAPASIPAGTPQPERFRILQKVRLNEPTPDDLVARVFTVDGTVRVLRLALEKVGVVGPDADELIDALSPYQAKRIAFEASGLLSPEQYEAIFAPPRPPEAAAATTFGSTAGGGESPLPAADPGPAAG